MCKWVHVWMGWKWVTEDMIVVSVVPGENEYGRRKVDSYPERRLYVSNMYFKHNSVYKYTRDAIDRDIMKVVNIIELVLVKRYILN